MANCALALNEILLKEQRDNSQSQCDYTKALAFTLMQEKISFEEATLLIEAGANVNATLREAGIKTDMDDRTTLLEFFILGKNKEVTEFLISKGAEVESIVGMPFLHQCIDRDKFNHEWAKFLLDRGFDINYTGKYANTALFPALYYNNTTAVKFLCERGIVVDLPNKEGELPLSHAILCQSFDSARILIQHDALSLTPETRCLLLETKEGQDLFAYYLKHMAEKLSEKGFIEKLTLENIKTIPFSQHNLTPAHILRIINRLKWIFSVMNIDPIAIKSLNDWLEPAVCRKTQLNDLHTFNIIAELTQVVLDPALIDQKNMSLCGAAAVLTCLAKDTPTLFIDFAKQLVLMGSTELPFPINNLSSYSRNQAKGIVEVLLIEMRRAYNYTGYSPTSGAWLEGHQGSTHAGLVCRWLEACGFKEIRDLFLMENQHGNALCRPLLWLANMAYCCSFNGPDHNNSISKKDNFNAVLKHMAMGKQAILCISSAYVDKISDEALANYPDSSPKTIDSNDDTYTTFCCFPVDHWVYLNKLQLLPDNKVEFELMTYGETFSRTEDLAYFLTAAYRGAILATSPRIYCKLEADSMHPRINSERRLGVVI